MRRSRYHKQKGFSSIEATVILVLVGLGIATIMAGRDLVKTAQLRQIITESQEYAWNIDTFETFYEALPGDFANALEYWPESASGDGNGLVDNDGGEIYRVWEHLRLTRLINGEYDGTTQLPTSPLGNNISYRIEKQPNQVYSTPANTRNGVHLRSDSGWHGAISPIDAHEIDNKMDDGNAAQGRFVAYSDNKNGCTKTEEETNASMDYTGVVNYNLNKNAPLCSITYWVAAK